ncbi:glycosyl hydrolase family protein [Silvibacterium acidisoli]|uniref:glycosyl hydrolase family protein n=1 Tax=Acidobacteriaceae bacterium ZG23-2 TaxID=2883246 RepID=UPI00406C2ABD
MQRFIMGKVAVAVAILLASGVASAQNDGGKDSVVADVKVSVSPGPALPANFLGLSHEWPTVRSIMGYSGIGVNTVYRQLIANLTAYGNDPIFIRIGGNSADTTGVPGGDRVKPLEEFWLATHSPITLDLNFGSNDLELAKKQIQFYLSQMPPGSIKAFEIGNEADAYPKRKMRAAVYQASDYVSEFDQWKTAILPMLPAGVKLVGPSWSTTTPVLVDQFLPKEASALSIFSVHYYAGNPYSHPPPDYLLKPGAATNGPTQFQHAIQAAHDHGVLFRVNEFGSFFGAGAHGLSDAFSAALWSIDSMFEYWKAGADGIDWEADGVGFCSPFITERTPAQPPYTYTLQSARPYYYGLLFFQASSPKGSRLMPVEVKTSANVKVWATSDNSHTVRVAIINKDESARGHIHIHLAGYKQATVTRLVAPSFDAMNGVLFAGQTLDGSEDGKLVGPRQSETLVGHDGEFDLTTGVTSAALVTFSR